MSYRKFPIKFYEKPDGSIYYENKFMRGTGKTIDEALMKLSKKNLDWDFLFFYDDVVDVQIGRFIPSLRDKKYKEMKYLGELELSLNIDKNWGTSVHSVTHLSKHPEDIEKQEKFIKKLQFEIKKEKVIKSITNGLKKLVNKVRPNTFTIDELLEVIKRAES